MNPIVDASITSLISNTHISTAVSLHSNDQAPLPEWCFHNEDQLPAVYKQVFEACIVDGMISTERLYPILLLSGLPRENLAQIWSICNTTTPGQLNKKELWLILAFIALTQNNHNTVSFDILHRCPVAPVPVFIQVQESLFGDINSTPKLLGLDSSSGDYHLHNTLNSQEITTTSLGWNGKHTLSDVDLVELNSGNDGLGHVNVGMRQVLSPNDSDTSKQKSFKMSTSVRLSDTSVLSNKDYTSEGKDNLRYFALNALSMNSDVPSGKISDSATEKCHMYKLGEICINTETNLDNSDWYCFNSADARDCVTKACVPDLSLDDREINGSSSTCVTIKKQNIETQEMIDLLHVRDDPTILSIYQSTTFQAQSSSKESPSRYIQDSHHSSTADQQLPQAVDIDDDAGFPVDTGHDEKSDSHDLDFMMQQEKLVTLTSIARTSLTDPLCSHSGIIHQNVSISTRYHQTIQPQELLASMPNFADKYNIGQEAQGSDRLIQEWERCLQNCYQVISEANTIFNSISSSAICNEVLKSSQGLEYVRSVIEIYRVACRVLTSVRSTAISTTELEKTFKSIDLAWNNLTAFLVGASILPKQTSLVFTHCILKLTSEHAQDLACGVCLLNVDATSVISWPHSGDSNNCKLTYAGRQYHTTCANLWVNCVDQTLPSLSLPDLL